MDSTDVQDDIIITVQMLSKLVLVNLNLKASLSEVHIDIPNFAKLGVSIENSNTKNNVATSLNYNIIEYKKRSLRLKLEPTKEFIEAIKDVIDSKDPRKFKDIINDFGAQVLNMEFGKKSSRHLNTSNSSKYQSFKLFGENNLDLGFQFFVIILEFINTIKLNIPKNILEILQHKDTECSVFATVNDKKEKDILNCQVICSQNEDPRLKIHCIQKKFRKRKLMIEWKIIGYDINFDF
ncbi:hypothetical protein GLOIN_2v1786313 [Rhizophagus irregularis DAOM 181602=DAOM 197198]|nr:hypothetical protein GLOIN_2v1786313 [Rhizophagus irregularis DAOM 181602=DAOM 197198]